VPRKSPSKRPPRAQPKSRKPKAHKTTRVRRRRRSRFVTILKLAVAVAFLWGLGGVALYLYALTFDLRQINDLPQRSVVLDRDGKFYSRLAGENRVVAPFHRIAPDFIDALVSREDNRFFTHHGVDPVGIARAAVRNLLLGGIRQGGSTITQQLARNAFPLGGRTLQRKLVEAALAFRIETELTKEEILAAYVNRIYFGSGYYGVDTASRAYFGKPAADLTLSESALLAGLIRSPTRLSPFNDLTAATRQRDLVLQSMRGLGLVTASEAAAARAAPVRLAPRPPSTVRLGWAMETVQRELDLVLTPDQRGTGGLTIATTIDPTLQQAATRIVADRLAAIERLPGYRHPSPAATTDPDDVLQAALIAIDNRTGGIRAIVGGRGYGEGQFNRAFQAERPAGSTVKPFVFATAFERGLSPRDRIADARLSPNEIPRDLGPYDPGNSDGKFGGDISVANALVRSRNTATIRVGLRAGLPAVADTFVRAGLAASVPPFPSICLGAFETTLRDLTAAYTAFPTGGTRLQPHIIAEVTNAAGRPIFKATGAKLRIFTPTAAAETSGLLADVLTRGTAASARRLGLRRRAAGKTGTTDDSRDAWFVGYVQSLTCGVWVGFDRPRPIMKGGAGATLALPIWVDFIQATNPSRYPD
jgi:penicillin-binding protein 1A